MSIYGEWLVATIAQNATSSAVINLGRDFDFLEIQIPTLDPCTIKLTVAEKTGDTFRDLGDGVATGSGTHNYHDVFALGGWQFIKVVASASQTSALRLIRVRGMRY